MSTNTEDSSPTAVNADVEVPLSEGTPGASAHPNTADPKKSIINFFWGQDQIEILVNTWASLQSESKRQLTSNDWELITVKVNFTNPQEEKSTVQCRRKINKMKMLYHRLNEKMKRNKGSGNFTWKYYQQFKEILGPTMDEVGEEGLSETENEMSRKNAKDTKVSFDKNNFSPSKSFKENDEIELQREAEYSTKRQLALMFDNDFEKGTVPPIGMQEFERTTAKKRFHNIENSNSTITEKDFDNMKQILGSVRMELLSAVEEHRKAILSSIDKKYKNTQLWMDDRKMEMEKQGKIREEELEDRKMDIKSQMQFRRSLLEERRKEVGRRMQLRKEKIEIKRKELGMNIV